VTAGSYEHGKETSVPIKGEEFLDQLMNNYLSRNTLLRSITSLLIVSVVLIVTEQVGSGGKTCGLYVGCSQFEFRLRPLH
jgi:hypothetical protein